jgi:hypothetical protein
VGAVSASSPATWPPILVQSTSNNLLTHNNLSAIILYVYLSAAVPGARCPHHLRSRKKRDLCFLILAHVLPRHVSRNSSIIMGLRTFVEKHPGVGVFSLRFHPPRSDLRAGLTRPGAADTIVSLAPQPSFAVRPHRAMADHYETGLF